MLASPYYACFEPIEKQSAQPHHWGWGWADCMECQVGECLTSSG
ncbi:hypothetical protein HMPREF1121_01442 [Porphyromonas sp. KLE 1280]|nr:hypothetical protein HMPREF1121_01442 [Porphyromonas sp. KLE 1280]